MAGTNRRFDWIVLGRRASVKRCTKVSPRLAVALYLSCICPHVAAVDPNVADNSLVGRIGNPSTAERNVDRNIAARHH